MEKIKGLSKTAFENVELFIKHRRETLDLSWLCYKGMVSLEYLYQGGITANRCNRG